MALVESLNEVQSNSLPQMDGNFWIEEVLGELLKEKSDLIAGVETGKYPRSDLELELVKLMDKRHMPGVRASRIQTLMNHMFGYGTLQKYIEMPEVTDIIMTHFQYGVIIKNGITERIPIDFQNVKAFENFLKLIVIRQGGKLNEHDAHARVSDPVWQLRINAIISPRASSGPILTIRKHQKKPKSLDQLLQEGFLTSESLQMVKEIACNHSRFLICGKGAAGKTTLMRAMIDAIGTNQRLMICESDQEIFAQSPTMVAQLSRMDKREGRLITLDDLIKDGLTMNMDGYCIGEITGKEAWSFIKAGYTDHRIMATIHASSAQGAIKRLVTLCELKEEGVGQGLVEEMAYGALDYVIYVADYKLCQIEAIESISQSCRTLYTMGEETNSCVLPELQY